MLSDSKGLRTTSLARNTHESVRFPQPENSCPNRPDRTSDTLFPSRERAFGCVPLTPPAPAAISAEPVIACPIQPSVPVGLTATLKDEIDRNTYGLFDLENGVPTDEYSLDDAIKDKMLVPPVPYALNLQFPREGIHYNDLSEYEKAQWDELNRDEEEAPNRVNAEAVNRWLFNEDTEDKVLEWVMTNEQKVAGGDHLGKTTIFAKNHPHAEFIVQRFDKHYPH